MSDERFSYSGLRAPGLLADHPVIGVSMFVFGTLAFVALLIDLLADGPLIVWDVAIAKTWPAIAEGSAAWVKTLMNAGYYLGDYVIIGIVVLLDVYFIYKRYWPELAMATLGLVGSTALFLSLSHLVARPRPELQVGIVLTIPGFPSGHGSAVVVVYGLLAYLLVPKMPSVFWKVVVVVAAVLMMLFVGFSRVFTGGHYLTDVLAGYSVGIAWAGALYTTVELLAHRGRSAHEHG